jgi:hypothetical protein
MQDVFADHGAFLRWQYMHCNQNEFNLAELYSAGKTLYSWISIAGNGG